MNRFKIVFATSCAALACAAAFTSTPVAFAEPPATAAEEKHVPSVKKDIVIVRTFDASVDVVWKAWTDANEVMKWWGPKLYTCPASTIDLKEGGKYVFGMRAPKEHGGQETYVAGTYQKIVPMQRLEFTQGLSDKNGNPIDPASIGMPPDFPKEIPTTVAFKSVAGKTTVTVTESNWTEGMMYDFSEAGMSECLDKLAASLPSR